MYIDTHAHVNFNVFKDDADAVIRRSLAEDTWLIIVGTDYKTSKRALDYANRYERGVYAAAGLHPIHLEAVEAEDEEYRFTTRGEDFNYDAYEKLIQFEKAVAVGEIGLDYYHINRSGDVGAIKTRQKDVFLKQLLIARRADKPAIIHCRQAHDDMVKAIKEFKKEERALFPAGRSWGVMHCFSGDLDLAWEYFNLGLLVSFTGLITFSAQWDDLIRKLPLDRIMIETDTPFMTPAPHRGQRNEPVLVKNVAKRIAAIKDFEMAKVAEITTKNARKLFRI